MPEQRFDDPKVIVTYRWKKKGSGSWNFIEAMYNDLAHYYKTRMHYRQPDIQEVIVNTRQVTGRIASEIYEVNNGYDTGLPMELFTST